MGSLIEETIFRPFLSAMSNKRNIIVAIATTVFASLSLYFICSKLFSRSVKPLTPDTPSKDSSLLDKIEKHNPFQSSQSKQSKPLIDGFQSIKKELTQWLTVSAQQYPEQYQVGSIDLMIKSFETCCCKEEFFKEIDKLKAGKQISGPSAYHIKQKVEELLKPSISSSPKLSHQDGSSKDSSLLDKIEKPDPFQSSQSKQPKPPVEELLKPSISSPSKLSHQDGSSKDPSLLDKIEKPDPFQSSQSKQPKPPVEELLKPSASSSTPLAWNTAPLDIAGLKMKLQEHSKAFPTISDSQRYGIRDFTIAQICAFFPIEAQYFFSAITSTVQKITTFIQISSWLQPYFSQVKLFTPSADFAKYMSDATQLLGRFDVLAVPCRMDYNDKWNAHLSRQQLFYIHHGAALNIGESMKATDFANYSLTDGSLDKVTYLQDMGKIFHQMLAAQQATRVEHAVWFPFGMGAFLRYLPKLDKTYQDPQALATLRQEIAMAFVQEVRRFPNLKIEMCLPLDQQIGFETHENYNAFVYAFSKFPELSQRVRFYINTDATDLAQRLANQYPVPYKVSLANGANRNLIGNHWFDDQARTAIDENLHRRSSLAAIIALLLNGGIKVQARQEGDLPQRVVQLGGQYLTV